MRLTAIIKYLFAQRSGNLIVLIFCLFVSSASGQKYSENFNGIPLSEALTSLSANYGFKVAFDAEKLQKVIIRKRIVGNSPEEIVGSLLQSTGYTYQFKHGTYLITSDLIPVIQPVFQLMGSVTDGETGEQLAYSSLSLINQKMSLFASDNGSFYFKNLKDYKIRLVASYIGYYQVDTILELSKPLTSCTIHLRRKYQAFDTLVVKGIPLEMIDLRKDVDFATAVNPAKLGDLPQITGTDVFKTLQLLPGVKFFDNSSELSIRGGTSDQNLVLYDGQTLYNLSHFFGLFSALNPNVIKDIQVYKGGFDSRYGERVSGIIDITGKNGTQAKTSIKGEVSLLSGNITAEIPLSKKTTLVAAVRRSYSDIYATGLSQNILNQTIVQIRNNSTELFNESQPSYHFYDFNTKLTYRMGERENLSVSLYGGKDYFRNSYFSNTSEFNIKTSDMSAWGNFGFSAMWQKQWNNAFYTTLVTSASDYSNDYTNSTNINFLSFAQHQNHKYLPDSVNKFNSTSNNHLSDYSMQLKNVWYLNNNNQINFGLLTRINSIEYHKDAEKVYIYDSISQSALTSSLYLQDKFTLFPRLLLKPGMRFSFFGGTDKLYFEPRFALNYAVSDAFSVRAATGKYYQFLSKVSSFEESGYYKNFWILSDEDHPVLKANHYIAGATFDKQNLTIDLETYYKTFSGLEEYIYISEYLNKNSDFQNHFKKPKKNQPPATTPASFFMDGKGKSYGMDLLLRYKYQKVTSWLSYSLSRTTDSFTKINKNTDFPSSIDQTHQVSWATMYTLHNWNFGSVVLFSTGRPYFTTSGINQLTRTWSRLPDYFRTDISANYSFRLAKAKIKTGISIINLFNNNNYFEMNNRKFDFENASFSETNQMLSQDLSYNLFLIFEL